MLFGSNRDFELLVKVNRELLKDIVEQEVLFYKLNLEETDANIYGEALTKSYFVPAKLNCLITRGDQVVSIDDFTLPDLQREASFAFLRPFGVNLRLILRTPFPACNPKLPNPKASTPSSISSTFSFPSFSVAYLPGTFSIPIVIRPISKKS